MNVLGIPLRLPSAKSLGFVLLLTLGGFVAGVVLYVAGVLTTNGVVSLTLGMAGGALAAACGALAAACGVPTAKHGWRSLIGVFVFLVRFLWLAIA